MGDFCYLGEWFEVCANTGTPNQHQIALFGSTNLSPRQDTLRTRHATHTPHTRHTRIHTRIHTRTSCQDVCNHLWKRTSGAAAAFVTSAAHCTNDNNHLHLPRLTGAARAQPSPHQVRLNCRVEGGVKDGIMHDHRIHRLRRARRTQIYDVRLCSSCISGGGVGSVWWVGTRI